MNVAGSVSGGNRDRAVIARVGSGCKGILLFVEAEPAVALSVRFPIVGYYVVMHSKRENADNRAFGSQRCCRGSRVSCVLGIGVGVVCRRGVSH